MRDVIPTIARILNKFEPRRLPMEMAFSLFEIATNEAASSGILVPTETTVMAMILSLTPS